MLSLCCIAMYEQAAAAHLVRRSESPHKARLLRSHQSQRRRQLRSVAHALGQGAREQQHVQQRLEGVAVQVGRREAELLHVLGDALVRMRQACAAHAWLRGSCCCARPERCTQVTAASLSTPGWQQLRQSQESRPDCLSASKAHARSRQWTVEEHLQGRMRHSKICWNNTAYADAASSAS